MKKTIAFIILIVLNTQLSAFEYSFKIDFPEFCLMDSCVDKNVKNEIRQGNEKILKENFNNRPNILDNNKRKRTPKQLQHFLYYV